MQQLIDLYSEHLQVFFNLLLADRTTGKNIVWATNAYINHGKGFKPEDQITEAAIYWRNAIKLQPRAQKKQEEQLQRTKTKGEVFTPSWLCNEMNNFADTEWFGRENVFNTLNEDHTWIVNEDKIEFPDNRTWKDYVMSRRMEITCGEAPFLVSRYDTVSGTLITSLKDRIGLLDRKIRIVNENTKAEASWFNWVKKAYQNSYGYEYQGDSLLIARINMFLTFIDYYTERWNRSPTEEELETIAYTISWNIWQMDGLIDTVPFGKIKEDYGQLTLFDFDDDESKATKPCVIRNWRDNTIIEYRSLKNR